MGSVFATQPDRNIRGFAGKKYSVPFFLQFVPGYVVEVVHSEQNLRYNGQSSINTIIALPHYTDKVIKSRQTAGEKMRYYPLLRGIQDVPTKGDPVLLCTIGKINYYLGPINTINNSPTWNDDLNYKKELTIRSSETTENTPRGERGESLNFNKEALYTRLQKRRNKDLDYGSAIAETIGDTIIEGRHGNSIRIGSRSNNPYVFISNERSYVNSTESLGDGSLISIISNGTLKQHFGNYQNNIDSDMEGTLDVFGFTLSSDLKREPNRFMGKLVSSVNGDASPQELIYDYKDNQMLLHSDRITINSKLDDIFISSIKDIHIGSAEKISMSSGMSLNILSNNVNIGNPNKATMENMVLGNQLQDVLVEIVNLLGRLQTNTSLGIQTPLTVGSVAGDIVPGEPIATVITNLETKIQNVISTKHKIEQG